MASSYPIENQKTCFKIGKNWLETLANFHLFYDTHPTLINVSGRRIENVNEEMEMFVTSTVNWIHLSPLAMNVALVIKDMNLLLHVGNSKLITHTIKFLKCKEL
jgi:hypothetical protein